MFYHLSKKYNFKFVKRDKYLFVLKKQNYSVPPTTLAPHNEFEELEF